MVDFCEIYGIENKRKRTSYRKNHIIEWLWKMERIILNTYIRTQKIWLLKHRNLLRAKNLYANTKACFTRVFI